MKKLVCFILVFVVISFAFCTPVKNNVYAEDVSFDEEYYLVINEQIELVYESKNGKIISEELIEGELPKGLELKSTEKGLVIKGTPTALGLYDFKVKQITEKGTSIYNITIDVVDKINEEKPLPTVLPTTSPIDNVESVGFFKGIFQKIGTFFNNIGLWLKELF